MYKRYRKQELQMDLIKDNRVEDIMFVTKNYIGKTKFGWENKQFKSVTQIETNETCQISSKIKNVKQQIQESV